MAPLSLAVLATILGTSFVFWMFLNVVKIPFFAKLKLS
jgi:hypothetical protein